MRSFSSRQRASKSRILRLGSDGESLTEDDCWRLLAVMAFPADEKKRHSFKEACKRSRKCGLNAKATEAYRSAVAAGRAAGLALLFLLQLDEHDPPATLERALPYVRAIFLMDAGQESLVGLPSSQQLTGADWQQVHAALRGKIHIQYLRRAFREFNSVGHFWTALALVYLERMDGVDPTRPSMLPSFVNLSEAVRRKAENLRLKEPGGRGARFPALWSVSMPVSLQQNLNIDVPPIRPALIAEVNP